MISRNSQVPRMGTILGACVIVAIAASILACRPETSTSTQSVAPLPGPSANTFTAGVTPSVAPSASTKSPLATSIRQPLDSRCAEGRIYVEGGTLSTRRKFGVAIAGLCVDRTEVTVGAYAACVSMRACQAPATGKACNWYVGDRELHPINCVNMEDAKTFCAWRNGRLPTYNEWEWIAEGRTAAMRYPWGNTKPTEQTCWSGVTKRRETCPVGSFQTDHSLQGIADLAGNVSEWTTTPFVAMPDTFVVAGGCWWDSDPDFLHIVAINHDVPVSRIDMIGFRCVNAL